MLGTIAKSGITAVAGRRALPSASVGSAPRADRSGVARLKLGVVSDIHVLTEDTDRATAGNTRTFRRALRWFDGQGVDAVIIAGDMADAGRKAGDHSVDSGREGRGETSPHSMRGSVPAPL